VDPARSNKGAGLGLSIARWIVDQHHGTIAARNNDGPGTTFSISLPLAS
jgi:signal transduction histidine kinase